MHIVGGNVEHISVYKSPPMFCFGGTGCSIEIDAVQSLQHLYWYGNDNEDSIPVVMIELKDGSRIAIDYDTSEEAQQAIKEFKKANWIKGVTNAD